MSYHSKYAPRTAKGTDSRPSRFLDRLPRMFDQRPKRAIDERNSHSGDIELNGQRNRFRRNGVETGEAEWTTTHSCQHFFAHAASTWGRHGSSTLQSRRRRTPNEPADSPDLAPSRRCLVDDGTSSASPGNQADRGGGTRLGRPRATAPYVRASAIDEEPARLKPPTCRLIYTCTAGTCREDRGDVGAWPNWSPRAWCATSDCPRSRPKNSRRRRGFHPSPHVLARAMVQFEP